MSRDIDEKIQELRGFTNKMDGKFINEVTQERSRTGSQRVQSDYRSHIVNYTDYVVKPDGRLAKPSKEKKRNGRRKSIRRTSRQELSENTAEAEREALSPHLMDVCVDT